MRVGVIIYGGLGQTSGGYLYDRMLVDALRKRGHRADVLSLRRRPYPHNIADNADPAVRSWMRQRDVVVQDEMCHPSLFQANGLPGRPPVVALVHNLSACLAAPAAAELTGAMEREYLEGTDAVVCTSRATLGACQALCSHLPPAAVVLPGKDHLVPGARRPGRGELRILHVGNVHPTKGLDTLLAALSELTFVPFRLEVAGGTADRAFRRTLDELMDRPLRAKVRFLGAVPPEGMAALYRRADVLAVPSRYEGLGIALLEALGFGVPVIAGRAGGAEELVEHGREGFLVSPGDHGAVAGHLRALADDDVREVMGRNARLRWERHPTWADSMGGLVDLLERVERDRDGEPRGRGGPGPSSSGKSALPVGGERGKD